MIYPSNVEHLAGIIADAAAAGRTLELRGGGSKAAVGSPTRNSDTVDMGIFTGVIDYDPTELVLTAGAGTPLADIEALVAAKEQMLAFEPADYGPLTGATPGRTTIGGIVASGLSGSRRVSAGGVRDHLLGFAAVSGRGEPFVAGAKVAKNVTGFDLPKLICGSWGRLAALTQVTLKVVPRPRDTKTVLFHGYTSSQACKIMTAAIASKACVAAAAHIPAHLRDGQALTALRLEGFGPSVRARLGLLDQILGAMAQGEVATRDEAESFWSDVRTLTALNDRRSLWRVSIPSGGCVKLLAALRPHGARYLIDWAGALIWLTLDDSGEWVRSVAASVGGHAMLVRAEQNIRAVTPTFHPPAPAIVALEARLRRAFDPAGVFETGRFGKAVNAD